MEVEFRVEELDEVVEGGELEAHAALVAEEVSFLKRFCVSNDTRARQRRVRDLPCDS